MCREFLSLYCIACFAKDGKNINLFSIQINYINFIEVHGSNLKKNFRRLNVRVHFKFSSITIRIFFGMKSVIDPFFKERRRNFLYEAYLNYNFTLN